MITQARLKEVIMYNPCSGKFYWRITRLKAKAGKEAGAIKPGIPRGSVYRTIKIDRMPYRAARLAWLYVYGVWPDIIDHVDGRSLNDSIWNLASGTQLDNMRNPITRRKCSVAAFKRHNLKP